MKSAFEKKAVVVAERLASELDDQLQLEARKKGWTAPIHLEAKKGKLNLVYSRKDAKTLFVHEYGDKGESPTALVRPFLNAIEPLIAAEIEEEALNHLFERGILP